VGYYKGNILRSSYEYVFAKYLDTINKVYKTEYKTYNMDGYTYTPDFFIFNNKGQLEEIVEVRGYRLNIQERIIDTKKLAKIVKVKVKLLTEIDLKIICKQHNLNYNQLIIEWKNSPGVSLNNKSGKFNNMYGKNHSNITRKILSDMGKKRMSDNDYVKAITKNMLQYCRDTDYACAKKPRSKRVKLICQNCNKEFIVTEAQSYKKYCSTKCMANSDANMRNLKAMSNKNHEACKQKHYNIKQYVNVWARNNKDIIANVNINSITRDLSPLLINVEKKFGIKDCRTIAKAVCGSLSRKKLVEYLRELL